MRLLCSLRSLFDPLGFLVCPLFLYYVGIFLCLFIASPYVTWILHISAEARFFPPSFTCLPVCFSCIWVHICINLTKPPILVYESAWKARISQQKLFAIANYTDVSLLWDTEIHQQPCRYPFVYILKENDIPVTLIPLTSGIYARPPVITALTSVTSHQNVSNNWTIMALFQPTLC